MKKFLSLAAVLVAALFLASCCRFHHGPCGPGPGPGMAKCADCPKAADCECKKAGKCLCASAQCKDCPKAGGAMCKDGKCTKCGKPCQCGPGCACPDCAAMRAAGPCENCPKAGLDAKELQHGPCGAPEGAPAK